ncbi:hypothetical protein BH18ACT17_BH18ACT17_16740 [soil metagenome]
MTCHTRLGRALTATIAAAWLLTASCGGSSEPDVTLPTDVPAEASPSDPGRATVVAVGDIACGTEPAQQGAECRYDTVAEAVADEQPDLFFALGDLQYVDPSGEVDFSFYDSAFGGLRSITVPTAGDEDWGVDREAFEAYFGSRTTDTGYDALEVAGWQVLVLNSQDCFDDDGCGEGSEQYEWLREQLDEGVASADERCTLAIWHDPRFLWAPWWEKDGVPREAQEHVAPFWALLGDAGAEVVLNANAHHYERWAPLGADGGPSAEGIVEFVVGTGGKDHAAAGTPSTLGDAVIDDAFGVLKLTLHDGGYDFAFVPAWGDIGVDSGEGTCH